MIGYYYIETSYHSIKVVKLNMSYITWLWVKLIVIIGTSFPYGLKLHFEKEIKMKIYMQNISFLLVDNNMNWLRWYIFWWRQFKMQNNLLFHLYNKLQVDKLGIYAKYFWGYKRQLNVKLAVVLLLIKIQENK